MISNGGSPMILKRSKRQTPSAGAARCLASRGGSPPDERFLTAPHRGLPSELDSRNINSNQNEVGRIRSRWPELVQPILEQCGVPESALCPRIVDQMSFAGHGEMWRRAALS